MNTLILTLGLALAPTGARSMPQDPADVQAGGIDLWDLIDEDAECARVVRAFGYSDGPAFAPDGTLLLSDNRAGHVLLVNPDAEDPAEKTDDVIPFLEMAGHPQDLAYDAEGNLFICQASLRRIAYLDAAGKPGVLVDRYKGKRLNSPANLVLDDRGGIYFTDPRYGRMDDLEMTDYLMAVYYLDTTGELTRVIPSETDSVLQRPRVRKLQVPNGIALSPDGKTLYVGDTRDLTIWRYEVIEPGMVDKPSLFYRGIREDEQGLRVDYAGPDSLVCDELGNIWAAFGVLVVFSPEGEQLGRIPVPELPTDMAFGGKDGTTLFITARNSLYKLPTKVHGLPHPKAFPRRMKRREIDTKDAAQEPGVGATQR